MQPHLGTKLALAAVLVGHRDVDLHLVRAVVQADDERAVALLQELAPQLARARQLALVRIEFLREVGEADDPRVRGALAGLKLGRLPPALMDGGRRWWLAELAS